MTVEQVAYALNLSVATVKKDTTNALRKIERAIRLDPTLRRVFVQRGKRRCRS